KHNDLPGGMVYRPIVELDTEDVWEFLAFNDPPWGSSHLMLIGLYRNASGGECPVVTQKPDVPAFGTSSSRFGCYTCTADEKDRRQARRRDGRVTITDGGTFVPGPFTIQTRQEILERLRKLEADTGQSLITDEEVGLIHEIWAKEIAAQAGSREMSVREIRK